jgi:chemotaxis protein CheD
MKAREKKAASSGGLDAGWVGDVRYIDVGIGETVVSRDRSAVLVAYGIGSCVGVCVYDPAGPAAGMAHVLLPNSGREEKGRGDARYADVAVPKLIRRMRKSGDAERKLVVKLAGGANVVRASSGDNNIGMRNVKEIRKILEEMGCGIAAEEVCGDSGRTIRFRVESGELTVTSIGPKGKTVVI